jgi:hypothetical protein
METERRGMSFLALSFLRRTTVGDDRSLCDESGVERTGGDGILINTQHVALKTHYYLTRVIGNMNIVTFYVKLATVTICLQRQI